MNDLKTRAAEYLAWLAECRQAENPTAALCARAKMVRWSDDEPDMWEAGAQIIRDYQRREAELVAWIDPDGIDKPSRVRRGDWQPPRSDDVTNAEISRAESRAAAGLEPPE